MFDHLEVRECKKPGHVMTQQGVVMKIPAGWGFLPPGDAALSRRVKTHSVCWVVKKRKGNKLFSLGIWTDEQVIARVRVELEDERKDPRYQKRLDASREQRRKKQSQYELDFEQAVCLFLNFDLKFKELESVLAKNITQHAIPVGSGTVARTQRIPIEQRARAATIAWLRHQTTAYDSMYIPRVKGVRREVRSDLAKESMFLLDRYRRGLEEGLSSCPLYRILKKS